MGSSSRREFLRMAVGGLFAASFLGSRAAHGVFMGPEQKREELFMEHEDLLTQPVRNSTTGRFDGKDHPYVEVNLEPYNYKDGDEKLLLEYYPVAGPGPHPVMITLPMLGGISFVERGFARHFSEKGMPVIIMSIPKGYRDAIKDSLRNIRHEEDLSRLSDAFNDVQRKSMLGVMRTVDWIGARRELDASRIGALGISLGAIILSSIMGVYAEKNYIKAGACILGGGNIHHIIAHSKEPGIKRDRKALLEAIGRDQDWLEKRLEGAFHWDPIHHAHNINGENMLLIVAKGDTYVPTETGLQLAEAIGNSRVQMVGSITRFLPIIDGHLAAYFKKGKIHRETFEFFSDKLRA